MERSASLNSAFAEMLLPGKVKYVEKNHLGLIYVQFFKNYNSRNSTLQKNLQKSTNVGVKPWVAHQSLAIQPPPPQLLLQQPENVMHLPAM